MTSPPQLPPAAASETVEVFKAFSAWANAALARAHLVWALVLVAVLALTIFAGFRAYAWHVNETARLAADVQREQLAQDTANARAERWERRAEALADSVRVDTQLVTRIFEGAPKPVFVPITAPSGVTSIVPMIPAVTFDSAGAACSRLAHDCTQALASKDSVTAQLRAALAAGDSLVATRTRQVKDAERASLWSKILYGVGGTLIGRATCSVH